MFFAFYEYHSFSQLLWKKSMMQHIIFFKKHSFIKSEQYSIRQFVRQYILRENFQYNGQLFSFVVAQIMYKVTPRLLLFLSDQKWNSKKECGKNRWVKYSKRTMLEEKLKSLWLLCRKKRDYFNSYLHMVKGHFAQKIYFLHNWETWIKYIKWVRENLWVSEFILHC